MTTKQIVAGYAGVLLLFISPLCFGVVFGWRWGLFSVPFLHFIWCWLKLISKDDNGSNTKTDN